MKYSFEAISGKERHMITVIKPGATKPQIDNLISWFQARGLKTNVSEGEFQTIIGLIGDVDKIDIDLVEGLEIVDSVKRVSDPYKRANRKFCPKDTVVEIGAGSVCSPVKIGGGHFQLIAGPCSVESSEQILSVAVSVHESGAALLRGGAFKPRTSPYDFQGMKADGIELLLEAKAKTGMPIVTEIMNAVHIPLFKDVDVIQVGARNMQNFELLKELGKLDKPILLKRGLANTLQELLMSAEYIMSEGNRNVILCERGIRTFETATRNTLDLSAVPVLKELSHLPVVIDPSHATGKRNLVLPMAMAAAACGADGLMIEVHNNPAEALCDGAQSLTPEQFDELARKVEKIRGVV
jgi:3-deoxy-7-phosphoheptulonate synthase